MRPRVITGRFMIRFGKLIQSLAVSVMRPDDLIEFSRQTYSRPKSVERWGQEKLVDSGLNSNETALLDKVPFRQGRLLLLDVGGGREAIPLTCMGFEVTGVDFVPDMIRKARENASRRGVEIKGIVQELSRLDVPQSFYDVAWLSAGMYSSIPTTMRRIQLLGKIRKALRTGGYFVCEFQIDTGHGFSRKQEIVRRAFTFFTMGNFWYEKGDTLWANQEFIHAFSSEEELMSEFGQGGFEVVHIRFGEKMFRGGAVLSKGDSGVADTAPPL